MFQQHGVQSVEVLEVGVARSVEVTVSQILEGDVEALEALVGGVRSCGLRASMSGWRLISSTALKRLAARSAA
ncbi:hypothetical protein ACWCPF_32645 [Streptomyces sp. NPDC001858]